MTKSRICPGIFFLSICFTFILTGCGYHLVNFQSRPSVFIEVFRNESLQPRLETYLIDCLRESVMEHPGFILSSNRSEADISIEGNISEFSRTPLFFSSGDPEEIIIGKFLVRIEFEIKKDGRCLSKDIMEKSFSLNLSRSYNEEKMLKGISEQVARDLFFMLIRKREEGVF